MKQAIGVGLCIAVAPLGQAAAQAGVRTLAGPPREFPEPFASIEAVQTLESGTVILVGGRLDPLTSDVERSPIHQPVVHAASRSARPADRTMLSERSLTQAK